ncbi:class I SAM-dependent methyltransferase [Actinomycetospora termitidis]|uniref:Class I SAM-dependent methyltransferase n=1 Tax=Actinomycetospora termitidis TaxID=3053470 RepID=A0ABT7MG71_9PSEU|nr:class I SAM-dependent methyltransferase [Actinomycetospora sp. Odt1-22]MDL5158353.1 class I SAM-dependent methyltransferase [Actinomycetospora sp. Odt1-22]
MSTTVDPPTTPPPMPDQEALDAFLGQFVSDLGATAAAAGVVIGHRLGLYRALGEGPATADELAARTNTHARPVAEWLNTQAAGGYATYDPATGRHHLEPAQAMCLTDPDGPVYLPAAFQLALGALRAEQRIADAFRTGTGMGWHEHDENVFLGCEAFFRPGYAANLTTSWIPALDGVADRLAAGGRVADVGCGLGASSTIMAQAYPAITVQGSDYHDGSIALARERATVAGVADRVSFEVASAQTFSGTDYDLVTTFDCLHDMGDPVSAARRVREALVPDGTWLLVEPAAGNTPADNHNPVGRLYYGFSTLLCVPNALAQSGEWSLGAQAGETALGEVVRLAGFTRFRRATSTPFNDVYEVRP